MKKVFVVLTVLSLMAVTAVAQDSPVVYRNSDGTFYASQSSSSSPYFSPANPMPVTTQVTPSTSGNTLYKPLAGDINGDGLDDIVITKANGTTTQWVGSLTSFSGGVATLGGGGSGGSMTFGGAPDLTVGRRFLGDINGDKYADAIVVNASNDWVVCNSSSAGLNGSRTTLTGFYLPGDVPLVADFTGDGRSDIALFRGGEWYVRPSLSSGFGTDGSTNIHKSYGGLLGEIPLAGDLNGDGKADIVVVQNNAGTFQWAASNLVGDAMQSVLFGFVTDTPLLADINGDGRKDAVVVRDLGNLTWYASFANASGVISGNVDAQGNFGAGFMGDMPLVANLVPEPATMAILGLGSLFAMRRRRA